MDELNTTIIMDNYQCCYKQCLGNLSRFEYDTEEQSIAAFEGSLCEYELNILHVFISDLPNR